MSSTPIADLSYRNYDGPIDSPNHRWWVIAKQVMRISLKKKSLWVLVFLTSAYYLMMMAVIYFTERSAEAARQAMERRRELRSLEAIIERLSATADQEAVSGAGTGIGKRLPLLQIQTRGAHQSALDKAQRRAKLRR